MIDNERKIFLNFQEHKQELSINLKKECEMFISQTGKFAERGNPVNNILFKGNIYVWIECFKDINVDF